jgi:hypothetical protein
MLSGCRRGLAAEMTGERRYDHVFYAKIALFDTSGDILSILSE